jgi:hypothetical protein
VLVEPGRWVKSSSSAIASGIHHRHTHLEFNFCFTYLCVYVCTYISMLIITKVKTIKINASFYMRLTSNILQWKRIHLLRDRPLFLTEYRTKIKSLLPLHPMSTKSIFCLWVPTSLASSTWICYHVSLGVFTAVTMNSAIFWDIKPSSYFTGDTLHLRYRAQPVNAM